MSVNLYTQTEYSMLDSVIKLESLMKKSTSLGYNTIAITDDFMHGTYKFYNKCIENNIKPIIGLKVYVESEFYEKTTLLLYAKNNKGYEELMRVSTKYNTEKKLLTFNDIKELKDVVVVSAGSESDFDKLVMSNNKEQVTKLYNKYNSNISDFYLGLEKSNYMGSINSLGKTVVISKTTYLEKEDNKTLGYLRSVKKQEKKVTPISDECIKTLDELRESFYKYEDAIKNLNVIKSSCNVKLDYKGSVLPKFTNNRGVSSSDYLKLLCNAGLKKRLANQNVDINEYINRLKYEINIICNMGFEDYFLIVFDLVSFAKKESILVGPGRGSACGSLVSYCLGITDIDPLKYGLLFERFLNPERISMPDIDLDFPDNRRDEVIQYVRNKYGKESVAHIATFSTLQSKSSIRDIARVMNLRKEKLEDVVKLIKSNQGGIINQLNNSKQLQSLCKDEEIKELIEVSSKIEGLIRQTSTHAAGIIVNDTSLIKYTALSEGIHDVLQTQFEAKDLEEIGLLKIDFLGLRNLALIDSVVELINENRESTFNINQIPLNDEKTFALIASGDTDGLFQLESQGMRQTLIKMEVNSFNDIVAALALYRPGPMENIDVYCKRKKGQQKVQYVHDDLINILEDTYGIIIYQEQIMEIVRHFANYSLGEADILRRAVSKKELSTLEEERTNFVRKSIENNHSKEEANNIYDYIVKFANYGFNKAHSVAYSMIAYQLGYLKSNYSNEFMSIMLTNSLGSENTLNYYKKACKKNGVMLLPPDINKSTSVFVLENNGIVYPLTAIRGLNFKIASLIIEERQNGLFLSSLDFINRMKNTLNDKLIENLVFSSAFDSFGDSKKDILNNVPKSGMQYFEEVEQDEYIINRSKHEYSLEELIEFEKEALGTNVKYSKFEMYEEFKNKNKLLSIGEIDNKKVVRILAEISALKEIQTKNNDAMAFLTLSDNYDSIDAVIFPEAYKEIGSELELKEVFAIKGNLGIRNGKKQLVIENIRRIKI